MAVKRRKSVARRSKPVVRRRATSVVYSKSAPRRRRRISASSKLFNKGIIMNIAEAAAGGIAAGFVKKSVLPMVGLSGLAGAGAGVAVAMITGSMLKRPFLAAGMGAVFIKDAVGELVPALADNGFSPYLMADRGFVDPFLLSAGSPGDSMNVPSFQPKYY